MKIVLVPAYSLKKEIKELFTEYTNMLIEGDSGFEEYLEIQNYDEELEHLETKYGMPAGRLFLAYYDNKLAGCIGLRKIDESNCEMKRLYVKPEFRGKHIGDYLVQEIIKSAKEIGYSHILLDTLPFLQSRNNYRAVAFLTTHAVVLWALCAIISTVKRALTLFCKSKCPISK